MKSNHLVTLAFLTLIVGLISCLRPPNYNVVPEISFEKMTKSFMSQDQFNTDSLLITINFTDGDGDIGNEDGEFDMFIRDTRDSFMPPGFRLPKVPEQGVGNGISGEISFVLFTTCCFFPDGSDPCSVNPQFPEDTVSYLIYIKDRAGRQSNVIETPPIRLLCD